MLVVTEVEPTDVPPDAQATKLEGSEQTKNATLPDVPPAFPESVAVSCTCAPTVAVPLLALVTTLATGAIAEAFIWRSWAPPPPSIEVRNMWYGEPLIEPAPFPMPQSTSEATWPPQAITAVEAVEVKSISICCWSAARVPSFTSVIDPLQIDMYRLATGDAGASAPAGIWCKESVVRPLQPATPASAPVIVRL